ncbi:MAG: mechanosensitive ion channel family protein [Acidilobaceae archaeon]|nr:mechanosensitive ion channel family protein [Acidilobaceae archaeon]MCX8165885.1 mechanosensitive ion channel family protein [Acidilobaceae archaeon]MDW7974527.1 mechanosensitive ion channel family protein [Sulfolobales archaeon]
MVEALISQVLNLLHAYGIDRFANAFLIVTFSLIVGYVLSRYLRLWAVARLPIEIAVPLSRVVFLSVIVLGALIALRHLGVDISVLLVAGGVAGLALGFAAQTVVSNLLSGIFLYFDRPFKVGDAIAIGDRFGIVEDITIFSTRIRLFDGRLLRVSNEEVFKSNIINLANIKARRVEYQIVLAHGADATKATEVIKRVLDEDPLVLVEPAPLIFSPQVTLDGIVVTVWAWTTAGLYFDVWTALLSKIREELTKEGIKLAVPQRIIRLREGEGL